MLQSDLIDVPETAVVHKPLAHDSARLHVQGSATYVDDIREPEGALHVAMGMAGVAAGELKRLDLAAVKAAPGVVAVIAAADIPGRNDIAPVFADEPLLVEREVMFHGQAVFAVVARTRDEARRAAKLGVIEIEPRPPSVTIADALATGARVQDDYAFARGDAAAAVAASAHRLEGQFAIGGQEHFYLEGQVSLAVPGEGDEMMVYASSQDPTETQHIVARVLGVPDAFVTVETRRMGGGFGGKESQACTWAAMAAVAAKVTGRPCKVRLDRDDDFALTGKRHDFRADWAVGYDDHGVIAGYDVMLNARCGCSVDLTPGVVDRAMFHAGNGYWLPDVAIGTRRLKTNTVSNTAFRGFGGPQGMIAIERVMDAIARERHLDPLDVRKANLLRAGLDRTPYGQAVEDFETQRLMIEELERTSAYRARRAEIAAFNRSSPWLKRGIALTPLMFGISFTLIPLNQAGALVHVYSDGSIHLNHGGTEMGQGLFTKVAQIVAEEFGVPLHFVRITATNTAKVPNASPTAASSGTDLNGMAAKIAAAEIKGRMAAFAAAHWGVPVETVAFRDARAVSGNHAMDFAALAKACRLSRVQLSHAGHYKTPDIHWDRAKATGRPFFYFAYGAACSEVAIDTLTGEMRVMRADLLHDVGSSINPALDIGQVEGGFIQGMGWLTTEELVYDARGRLATHAPATYKIPVASDTPPVFNTTLHTRPNPTASVYRSKAVGEPPLMLAISVYSAILDAVHATSPTGQPRLEAPCTPESILKAIASLEGEG
ncbi:xanthine dehydrogenase molybdenum binding subunit apoprotein [Roseiarcus fermentans]|uniref:Xanthine dehydrogenase molybdenum binding subunit apoprotein n=1 Tax=Roseiarcus fermentans TaxID=1473586 RepID=A0A366F4S2_9HYPH|nr:xanthine dehydrogenase molybdopterin binding subunit [Roseiarcus fermentans]RBP09146.1 xanthine dehydrogenase molybdenum binding subunit apoprotein [Roseiarcus fermentans]